jgi:hypothetical protein
LTFNLTDEIGKQVLKRADDATDGRADRRRRALKAQSKTRDVSAIVDDASKMGHINKLLVKLKQMRDLH